MGTYAAVTFDHTTRKSIYRYCSLADIPNTVRPDKLHATLLYSDTDLPLFEPNEQYRYPLVAYPVGLSIWDTSDEGRPTKCLVVLLDCDRLIERHELLIAEHGARYPHPTYQPHMTLSYDVGDLEMEGLPFFENYVPHIIITGEYKEDLTPPIDTSVDAIKKTVVSNG